MKQEQLPLDPDEIGGPVQEIKPSAIVSNASHKSTPSLDDSRSQPNLTENVTVEPMDTNVGGSTNIDLTVPQNKASSSSQDQSVVILCDTKVVNVPKSTLPVQLTAGEYLLAHTEVTPVHSVIDLTTTENERDGYEDQFDDFMDNLNDEDFCTSFSNFDDDNVDSGECVPTNYDDKDKEYVPTNEEDKEYTPTNEEENESEDDGSESSDCEEWKSEGVDYVKTVAEMAEEAGTSDLFDPKVLGK